MYTCVCKHCKRVFRSKIRTLCCNACRSVDEDKFDAIVAYLKLYPNSNAIQISEELGVDAYEIVKYMEEGRLERSRGKFSRIEDGEGME